MTCPDCEKLRETNRRLNRRCQELEHIVAACADNARPGGRIKRGELMALNAKLQSELGEWLDMAMRSGAYKHGSLSPSPQWNGWWDSLCNSSICDIGDRLVELGLWERHPDGHGRRQFYRPITKEQP